ncbi:MAG: hypothetical protein JWN25_2982 [Verrucomicrobiales bacterium]|nr:hypothetical protein [Verrucomicrobiales bacterium]
MKTKTHKPTPTPIPEGNFAEIWQAMEKLPDLHECTIMVPVTVRVESWAMAAHGCKKVDITIGQLVSEIVDDAFWQLDDPRFMSLSTNREEEEEMEAAEEVRKKEQAERMKANV